MRTMCRRGIRAAMAALGAPAGCSSPAPSANLLACQHYETQRAWVKSLAFPTLADVTRMDEGLAADVDESPGSLRCRSARSGFPAR